MSQSTIHMKHLIEPCTCWILQLLSDLNESVFIRLSVNSWVLHTLMNLDLRVIMPISRVDVSSLIFSFALVYHLFTFFADYAKKTKDASDHQIWREAKIRMLPTIKLRCFWHSPHTSNYHPILLPCQRTYLGLIWAKNSNFFNSIFFLLKCILECFSIIVLIL